MPYEVLLNFIQTKELYSGNVSIKDLESPSSQFVQTIYFKILNEFNYSDSLFNTVQPEFGVMEELGEHAGMYQEVLPVISLLAAMQNLLTRLAGENFFGLQDLISPSSRRFRKFLSILANFYFFADMEYGKVEEVKTDVNKMVGDKKELEGKIEEYRNKINFYMSKAVEDAAEEEALKAENLSLEVKLNAMVQEQKRMLDIKIKEKQRFEEEDRKTKELEEELKRLENERDQIQAVANAEAVMVRLDEDLANYSNELAMKEKHLVDNRDRVEEVEKSTKVCQSLLESVQQISAEKQASKANHNEVEELKKNVERLELEGKDSLKLKREEDARIKEKSEVLQKLKSQWSRRKEGKTEELEQASQELQEVRDSFSEEQQRAMEDENKLRDLELECGEEQDGITIDEGKVRVQYNQILEQIRTFDAKMLQDMELLSDCRARLNQASSAL